MNYIIPKDEKKYLLKMTLLNLGMFPEDESWWDNLVDHVDVHKYFRSEEASWPLEWGEAVFSWMEEVFEPLLTACETPDFRMAFPDLSRAERLFRLSTHWYYLKQTQPQVSAGDAAKDYIRNFAPGVMRALA